MSDEICGAHNFDGPCGEVADVQIPTVTRRRAS